MSAPLGPSGEQAAGGWARNSLSVLVERLVLGQTPTGGSAGSFWATPRGLVSTTLFLTHQT